MKCPAILSLVLLGVLAWLTTAPAAAGEPYSGDPYKDRFVAARKVYEAYSRALETGKASLPESAERLYLWSRRMLDADLALAENKARRTEARKEHLARMTELEKVAEQMVKAGRAPQADADAVRFFRLEAEIWIAEAKKAKK